MGEYIVDFGSLAMLSRIVESESNRLGEPVVRCRDCKYYECVPEDSGDWCGYWTDRVYGADGFCAWGVKRKEDGE